MTNGIHLRVQQKEVMTSIGPGIGYLVVDQHGHEHSMPLNSRYLAQKVLNDLCNEYSDILAEPERKPT